MDKLDFIKIIFKDIWRQKYRIGKTYLQIAYDKELISRIYKGLLQFNNKKTQMKNNYRIDI